MKKITMLTLAVTAFMFSFAQIEKGSLMLGGGLGYNGYQIEESFPGSSVRKSKGIYVVPSVGYAVKKIFL